MTKIFLMSYVVCILLVYLVLYFVASSIDADKQIISSLATRQFLQTLVYFGIWYGFVHIYGPTKYGIMRNVAIELFTHFEKAAYFIM